ncbi:hypothetical protein E2562_031250 [Oryza meyeriana var. granulata]|uniref:Transposase MuDR plant domain-containing protein n=1 Tax=Oryza meyeriana var. granulata TaxID=110450 RepID=A0A6G1FEH8_9ORYZ|nr:hypothetical protein E2562_031250 [Oryza meyeriana var. granulata]
MAALQSGQTVCMRQYAVLKEVELAVPYSEASRYRAYCKAKKCKWRIHASREIDLEDYVSSYYSVAMFRTEYASSVAPMPDKSLWQKVDTGFKL